VLKGLKWMLSADAPLLVNPAPTLHKMRWMAELTWHISLATTSTPPSGAGWLRTRAGAPMPSLYLCPFCHVG
jgi:hypothetical protein